MPVRVHLARPLVDIVGGMDHVLQGMAEQGPGVVLYMRPHMEGKGPQLPHELHTASQQGSHKQLDIQVSSMGVRGARCGGDLDKPCI